MRYIKIQFAKELKEKIKNTEPTVEVGRWAYSVYFNNMGEIDSNFREILLDLSVMEEGKEFELSYKELEKIADDLIEEELKKPDLSISKSATILDEKWIMCPDCIDAWESTSKSAMVICPKCNQMFHNPRFQKDG
ncbi:MAG: hypothetical protein KFB95_00960 [Simkaniaceae bacterium]|nr:MAG: hypothetical protein KFB95_00960 [Simkaniaceae bacterium]